MWTTSILATVVAYLSPAIGASLLSTSTSSSQPAARWECAAGDLSMLAELMPESMLPPPGSSRELKYVLLGVGTQNYTCASGDESSAPGTTGAPSSTILAPSSAAITRLSGSSAASRVWRSP
ncbi:hypothetical protein OPT61_g8569 [Boeremia exigua]|uniref:Uncharacterized protein n=1 Tax=Boeremia exigua TaxID=749465 RepID=A0ACC2HXQ6_9PLEO|nr:hypothetical protein OPT61_g8569 [Boeremia exigua]